MKETREQLRSYVADMVAVEKHILEALERQHDDDTIKRYPDALSLVDRLAALLRTHVGTLESHLDTLPGGSMSATVKETMAGVLGNLAGLYDKMRKDEISRDLRDDYTALSLATVSYTMLHTTALGMRENATAQIALHHLQELTPFVMELAEIIPPVVLKELAREGYEIDLQASNLASRNAQEAWKNASAPVGATR